MAWEMTALDLADRCRIEVPPRSLVEIGGRSVLVVERFDRAGSSRVPYASARTLIGGTDRQSADYLEIAEALGVLGFAPAHDLTALFRRIAFSIAIHNTDDHLRNHGFLHRGSGWTLAPVFDVNPDPSPNAERVTSIGWTTSLADEVRALLTSCDYFGMTPEGARAVWHEVRAAVSTWRAVAASHGISRTERQMFAPVLDRYAPD